MIFLLLFITGSVFGSFLNVLVDRLSTGRPFVSGRSYCEHCKKVLTTRDLIPIFSYIVLGGKCRYCKAKIPGRIFLLEILSGILFILLYSYGINQGYTVVQILLLTFIFWSFLGIFFADLKYGIIPDLLVLVSIIGSFMYLFVGGLPFLNHLVASIGALIFFLTLFTITRGKGMGLGDVKLSLAMGFFLGFPLIIVSLYLAFLTGAAISIILVVWRKLRFFGGTIPFGPFLILSIFIAYFFGKMIIDHFLRSVF